MLHLEPEPNEFVTKEIKSEIESVLDPIKSILVQSNLIRPTVKYWIRTKISELSSWESSVGSQYISELTDKWVENNKKISKQMTLSDARNKVVVSQACSDWAKSNWNHLVNSLFLERKNYLDMASCNLIRVQDKHLALELYYRIKEGEESFSDISFKYGKSPERESGGKISLRPLERLPFGLQNVVPNIKVGDCSTPFRIGNDTGFIELTKFKPAILDESTKSYLLDEMLNFWIDEVTDSLVHYLSNSENFQAS